MLLCVATGENNLRTERKKKSPYTHLMPPVLCPLPPPPLQTKRCLSATEETQQLSLVEQFGAPWQTQWGRLSTVSFLSEVLHVVCRGICSSEPLKLGLIQWESRNRKLYFESMYLCEHSQRGFRFVGMCAHGLLCL